MSVSDDKSKSAPPRYAIPEHELAFRFVRSPGPGGQNVNKVATAVELRFDVIASTTLPQDVKDRLMKRYANRINKEGVLIIAAHRFRSQDRNRQDAMARLQELIDSIAVLPPTRRATKPTRASRQRRLAGKSHRAQIKQHRQRPDSND